MKFTFDPLGLAVGILGMILVYLGHPYLGVFVAAIHIRRG